MSARRFLHFAQMKAAALRDENLCIIRAVALDSPCGWDGRLLSYKSLFGQKNPSGDDPVEKTVPDALIGHSEFIVELEVPRHETVGDS